MCSLLWICCIFSERIFLRRPLDGCFSTFEYFLFWKLFNAYIFRSYHRKCSVKKDVLKNFSNFTGGLQACNFIKKRLQIRCCPLKFSKLFKYTNLKEHPRTTAPVPFKLLFSPMLSILQHRCINFQRDYHHILNFIFDAAIFDNIFKVVLQVVK